MSVLVPPAHLIGSDVEVPCADGLDAPLRQPRLRGEHARCWRAVWDAVEAFVPWYSSVHRGTGAKSRISTAAYEQARASVAALRRRAGRQRRVRPQHHRGDQRPRHTRCRRARACSPPRSSTTRTCSPGAGTTCACCRSRPRPTSCSTRTRERAAARADRPARGHRRLQRHRRGVAARASSPSSPTSTARSCSSTPPSSPRTARSTWPRPASTTSRSPATSSTRRSAPARSSAARRSTGDPLLHGGGAIKLVTRRRRRSGPTRPSASRPARRT